LIDAEYVAYWMKSIKVQSQYLCYSFQKKTPKSAAKPLKRGRPSSPATAGTPLTKKSRILGKSPAGTTKQSTHSPIMARVISVKPTVNHEKAICSTATITASASSTSTTTLKKPMIDGYDGWSSSVTSFRKVVTDNTKPVIIYY
jgi:hypothetical protein